MRGIARHYWILSVIAGAIIVALAAWIIRRRQGGGAIEPAKPVKDPALRPAQVEPRTTVLR